MGKYTSQWEQEQKKKAHGGDPNASWTMPSITSVDYTQVPENLKITAPTLPTTMQTLGSIGQWGDYLTKPVTAPQLGKLDVSGMPSLGNYLGDIEKIGQQQTDVGLKALERIFAPQTEANVESGEARGLTGAGVQQESARRLAAEQGQTAEQFIAETNIGTLKALVGEKQRVSEAENQRFMQILGLTNTRDLAQMDSDMRAMGMNLDTASMFFKDQSDRAMKAGDWQIAVDNANTSNALAWGDQELKKQGMNSDTYWNAVDADLKDSGLSIEERKADIEEMQLIAQTIEDPEERQQALDEYSIKKYGHRFFGFSNTPVDTTGTNDAQVQPAVAPE